MRDKITTEYISRIKKLCKSKLSEENLKNELTNWANKELLNIGRKTERSWQLMDACKEQYCKVIPVKKEMGNRLD